MLAEFCGDGCVQARPFGRGKVVFSARRDLAMVGHVGGSPTVADPARGQPLERGGKLGFREWCGVGVTREGKAEQKVIAARAAEE